MVTVAVDATPLLGRPTGVGVAVRGLLGGLPVGGPTDVVAYGLTGTGWRRLGALLPEGRRAGRGPMPAGVLQRVWRHLDAPPVEWWTGAVDVVHGTNFVVPPARHAARLVTVHDLTPLRYPELCTAASLRYPGLLRRAVAGGASVHTSTEFVAAEVRDHLGVDAARVHVVAWGVDAPAGDAPGVDAPSGPDPAGPDPAGPDPAGPDPVGPELGQPDVAPPPPAGRPYVLALGTVEPRKDYPRLVAAFDGIAGRWPDLDLRIVGPDGWGSAALDDAVARSPHRARIRRSGWVADRTALLVGATVLAYPSVYEGFGFPPLEAMALGVPVVATAAGGVPEVVGDAADVVPVGDTDALAAAIDRVISDAVHRQRLVTAGRARVGRFSWERTGAAMQDLYARLAP
jgi:glycosyltransferase involved in cell wall biosynthesis